MGLSWRSSSGGGSGHRRVANVAVNAAMPPPMMQIVMGREREREKEINRSGLGWGFFF